MLPPWNERFFTGGKLLTNLDLGSLGSIFVLRKSDYGSNKRTRFNLLWMLLSLDDVRSGFLFGRGYGNRTKGNPKPLY